MLHLLKEKEACHSVLLHPVLHTFVRACTLCYGTVLSWYSVGFLCLIVRCVLQPCVCLSLRWSASLVRDTFLSLCFNKHLVSKVGFAHKVCHIPRQIVHLWNTIWLNIPTQCPESRRVVFLNRSDPCGRCGSQLSVVVQAPEFGSRSPAQILASLPVTWLSSMAT